MKRKRREPQVQLRAIPTKSHSVYGDVPEIKIPMLFIVWDPRLVTEDQYCELVGALADLLRAHGGLGLERIRSQGFGVNVYAGVTP